MNTDQLNLTGIIHVILPEKSFVYHGKENKTRQFMIHTDSPDKRETAFTLYNNYIEKIKGIEPGDKVIVKFVLESKLANNGFITNAKCLQITKI